MHSIDVGIGRDHDPIESQRFDIVFDSQSRLKQSKLLIFIDYLLG